MARPRKEGMDYFPHDCNLSNDKKVEALRILHGNDGYVFFCIMLENIYQEPNFELLVSDAETIQILAKKVEVTPLKLEEMIKTAIKHGCFDRERYESDGVLTSNGIKKRAEIVVKKRVSMRESHEKKVSGIVSDAETMEESTQSKRKVKVKEKIKDIKKEYADYVFLTETEYDKLTELLGEYERESYFLRFAAWISGQSEKVKKSRSAYLTIRNWHRDKPSPSSTSIVAKTGQAARYISPSEKEAQQAERMAKLRKEDKPMVYESLI